MNLDDRKLFEELDRSGMIDEIRDLPNQLEKSWRLGESLDLPEKKQYSHILIAGMGGSAIGADMLASCVFPICNIPVSVNRGYDLPAWVNGSDVLVICSSHSGNTEETLSAFDQAIEIGCATMAVTTGGELQTRCEKVGAICWLFEHEGQPRSAVGYSFGLLYTLFSRLSFIPDGYAELKTTMSAMKEQISKYDIEVSVVKNLAKRLAGQAVDRYPVIFGADHLEPIARRWKTQINELAKAWAQFEFLPEADHNTLAGVINSELNTHKMYSIFLNSSLYNERIQKRFNLTFTEFMIAGFCTDKVFCEGKSRLEEIWTALLLGDFVAYYLAIAYMVDPTPIEILESFKISME